MINGKSGLTSAPYAPQTIPPAFFAGPVRPDFLAEYISSLSPAIPRWQPETAAPNLGSAYWQAEQSLLAAYQQAQQQVAQNPLGAPFQLDYLYQQAQQALAVTHQQAQIQFHALLQSYTQRQQPARPREELSDEELSTALSQAFETHPATAYAGLEIEVKNHDVTLRGLAPNRHVKRAAEAIAWSFPDARNVHNTIEIRSRRARKT
jgi:osmotically-inducible protein OsmY